MALQKSAQRHVFSAPGLGSAEFTPPPSKRTEQGGKAEPTWFSVGINLEYEVGDQIKIKDTFIIRLLDKTEGHMQVSEQQSSRQQKGTQPPRASSGESKCLYLDSLPKTRSQEPQEPGFGSIWNLLWSQLLPVSSAAQ